MLQFRCNHAGAERAAAEARATFALVATLANAALTPPERRALERLTRLIEEEFGDDLHGIWLYGSRARGEWTHDESDIDLLVVANARGPDDDLLLIRLRDQAAEAEGVGPDWFSVKLYEPERVAERRELRSFFMRGRPREDRPRRKAVSPRSKEFLREARERLRGAELALEGDARGLAVSAAYYAMLYAARAALSEEDLNAKTHHGTWTLFRQTFVATGRFDAALLETAVRRQELRGAVDSDARLIQMEEAQAVVDEAETFLAAVERLLGSAGR
jgi:uncharacterized protein (UPF0332 family)/predicted nucleotidyltransferase